MYFVLNVEYKSYSPEALWRYLTARHDWLSIISWIGEFQTQNSYSSLQQNKWPPLTIHIIDQSTCCNNNMRNKIFDELARYYNWGRVIRNNSVMFPLQCHESNGTLFHSILKLKGYY